MVVGYIDNDCDIASPVFSPVMGPFMLIDADYVHTVEVCGVVIDQIAACIYC